MGRWRHGRRKGSANEEVDKVGGKGVARGWQGAGKGAEPYHLSGVVLVQPSSNCQCFTGCRASAITSRPFPPFINPPPPPCFPSLFCLSPPSFFTAPPPSPALYPSTILNHLAKILQRIPCRSWKSIPKESLKESPKRKKFTPSIIPHNRVYL